MSISQIDVFYILFLSFLLKKDVQLVGPHILCEHCIFENSDGEVKLIPQVRKISILKF